MKSLFIIGASGRIGQISLSLINKYPNELMLAGVSIHNNTKFLSEYKLNKKNIALMMLNETDPHPNLSEQQNNIVLTSTDQLCRYLNSVSNPYVIFAIPGIKQFQLLYDISVNSKATVLMANKELICAGGHFLKKQLINQKIISIDSEINSLTRLITNNQHQDINCLWIGGSGGIWTKYTTPNVNQISRQMVLSHPNWKMGLNNLVYSSTMMNKILEMVECSHFMLPYFEMKNLPKIKVFLEASSICHAAVSLTDGSTIVFASKPSMENHILNALNIKIINHHKDYDIATTSPKFTNMGSQYQPILSLIKIINNDRHKQILFTLANDLATQLFLDKKLKFQDIIPLIKTIVNDNSLLLNYNFNQWCDITKLSGRIYQIYGNY